MTSHRLPASDRQKFDMEPATVSFFPIPVPADVPISYKFHTNGGRQSSTSTTGKESSRRQSAQTANVRISSIFTVTSQIDHADQITRLLALGPGKHRNKLTMDVPAENLLRVIQ